MTLVKYIDESKKAQKRLIELLQAPIDCMEIQLGLAEHFGLENSTDILLKDLDADQMVGILRTKDFSKPIIVEEVWLQQSVLPKGIPRLLTEETIKHKGERWRINKYDKDIFPSNPHAHNYDANVKLHLGTCELFNKRKELVGKLKRKQLEEIRSKVKNILLPTLIIS